MFRPMILDPIWQFPGSAWRSDRHWGAFEAACPNVIHFDGKPPIDYRPRTAAETLGHR